MGLFSRFRAKRATPPVSTSYFPGGSYLSFSDIKKNTTVIACAGILSSAVCILPLNLYRREKSGSRSKATDHHLYGLLKYAPNQQDSPAAFLSRLVQDIMYFGNAYLYRDAEGDVTKGLYLLDPKEITERYEGMKTDVLYSGVLQKPESVLRISSLVTDRRGKGFAPVDLARAAVILGGQLDEYSLSSFGNGLNTKLLIDIAEMTANITDLEQAQRVAQTVADYVRRNYSGAENAGKPLILWTGMKAQELKNQSSNRDAELLESRKWQELEICKVFGVPPWLVNGTYSVPYGGLEQAMTVFSNFNLGPYLRHIEQRLVTLLSAKDRSQYYFEFDQNVLLRPDEKSRGEFYAKLFQLGAIDANGICARENIEPPKEAGSARFVPANLMPLTDANIEAYMASQKIKIQDPARAAGDDKRANHEGRQDA